MHTHKRENYEMFKVNTTWQTNNRHEKYLVIWFLRIDGHWKRYIIMKEKGESEVAQSSPPLCDPMDCSLPSSSNHRIFQGRILEWVPFPSPGDLPNLLQSHLLVTYKNKFSAPPVSAYPDLYILKKMYRKL